MTQRTTPLEPGDSPGFLLWRKGLIERDVDAADTRARRVRVTQRGAEVARRAIAVVEEVDARFFADIPERETLRFLRRLVD